MPLASDVTATTGGGTVEFELTVRNPDDDPADVTFRSGLEADFAVLDEDVEIWRASDGQMFTQALRSETFDSGAEETYTARWPDPAPGRYTVVATLELVEEDVEARTDFSV
ncbi:BsuPI-related putative proteinase inhibitor [Haladaptatus halobius]|jgi:hypothetical protein|uniref:BsuPI-related putative proteinase inhibitor n=1 Tax=Haladaptatus halobius TaxID=2884875 RepID=UPI001D0B4D19|nr:BsuPI-related putative proteinase inhibitor [Haladaptatus halobius]